MLFHENSSNTLAISQPTHAWISGQLLRAWAEPLEQPLLLAAEQHDLGWLDWETRPAFDTRTGRPQLFRDVGAAIHAPMWAKGVERALDAWGTRVALLISRHGGVIYRRFTDRHRLGEADAAAAEHYLDTQAPLQAAWTQSLGLDPVGLDHDTALIAFADTLSLAICGELKTPLEILAPDRAGGMVSLRLVALPDDPAAFTLSPWPFRGGAVAVEGEARRLPAGGRFENEAAMLAWLALPQRVSFRGRLMPSP